MVKYKKIFFLLVCSSFIFLVSSPVSYARYMGGNLTGSGVAEISSQAGSFFLKGLSSVFFSVAALEDQNLLKANNILKTEVAGFISEALKRYTQIEKHLRGRKINLEKFGKGQLEEFNKNFMYLNFDLPRTDKELNRISLNTVTSFAKFIKDVEFTQSEKDNVDSIKRINEEIYNVMKLSISLAEIATAIE